MSVLNRIQPLREISSKRRRIYESLRDLLVSKRFPPGSRFPTAHVLAERFGVSYVTVHSALNDLVRDGWLVRHRGKGSFVTETGGGRSRPSISHLAMALPREKDIETSGNANIVLRILHGCAAGAGQCGSDLTTVSLPSHLSASEINSALHRLQRYHGAIFIGDQYAALMEKLALRRMPFVVLGTERDYQATVNYDRCSAVALGVEYLVHLGYRRIGFLGITRGTTERAAKFEYFQNAMKGHGLTLHPGLVEHALSAFDAHAAGQRLLDRSPLPDAIFVDNELKAETMARVAFNRGLRIPRDFGILTYGAEHTAAD
ncbi:MAG: GntR family transcriptional regulator, partial [Verrucomicrobia bacterium]|nr:GntR family transcriptional regulator [Verrucomicrobiota bacterium]